MTINLDLLSEEEREHYAIVLSQQQGNALTLPERALLFVNALAAARAENKALREQVDAARAMDEAVSVYLEDFVIEEMDDAETERIAMLTAISNFRVLQSEEKK